MEPSHADEARGRPTTGHPHREGWPVCRYVIRRRVGRAIRAV